MKVSGAFLEFAGIASRTMFANGASLDRSLAMLIAMLLAAILIVQATKEWKW